MSPVAVRAPAGFLARGQGRHVLLARVELLGRALDAGLGQPASWEGELVERPGGSGRGASGRLVLPGGVRLVVKRMRRGGLLARIWRDRFPGTARLLGNLSVPMEAARRGVPTAAPAAMLIEIGPIGLDRAWMAVDEIPGAEDLLTRLSGPRPPAREEIAELLRAVRRMHDAGVEHRDLNLANLLLSSDAGAHPEAWIVDLDRARLFDAPLPVRKRRAALLRMERSYLKSFGDLGPLPAPRGPTWIDAYAAGDRTLARALETGNRVARASLAIHRLGWRK